GIDLSRNSICSRIDSPSTHDGPTSLYSRPAGFHFWARRRGGASPTRLQWGYATVTGALLFLGGHGTIAWAEQRIPSGLAALLCATLPQWTVLLASRSEGKLGAKVWTGLLLGFGGVALLIGPDAISSGRRLDLLAAAAALL